MFVYLKCREERKREKEGYFQTPTLDNWAKLKPGARNSARVSHFPLGAEAQAVQLPCTDSYDVLGRN